MVSPSPALIDYHIHTTFSDDARSSPSECVQAAVRRSLGGIIFTDHLEFPPPPGYPEPVYVPQRVLPAAEYRAAVARLRQGRGGRLSIGLGAELGLEEHNLAGLAAYLARDDPGFDFVLGSLHSVKGVLVQFPAFTNPLGPAEAVRVYFGKLLAGVKQAAAARACDVVGHLDLVKRSPTFGVFRLVDHRGYLEEVLRAVVDGGLGLEVNTSGYRQPPREPYPGLETLKLYRELGGEIVTVGSDSHSAATVGLESAQALEFLRAAGFRYVTLFADRRPRFEPI